MKNRSPLEVINLVLLLGIILFSILIYLTVDPRLAKEISDPNYYLFLPILVPQWLAVLWLYKAKGKISWRPIFFILLIILQSTMILIFRGEVLTLETDNYAGHSMHFLGQSIIHIACFGFFLLSAFSLGDIVFKQTKETNPWIKTALGIILQTTIITLIGTWFGVSFLVVLLTIVIPLGLAFKKWPSILTNVLFKKRQTNLAHIDVAILLPILWLALGYALVGMIKPMAVGHDGNSVYAYLAKQVATGYPIPTVGQAYPWSVYLALPEVVTGIHSFSLFFSQAIGLVCLWLLFDWAKDRLSFRFSVWQTTVLALSPFLIFHLIIDEKVDLGSLVFVIIAFRMIMSNMTNPFQVNYGTTGKINWSSLAILVALLSFATLIKYTSVFYFLGLLIALLSLKNSRLASTGLFLVFVSIIVFFIDVLGSDLKSYVGLSPVFQMIIALTGLSFMAYDLVRNKGSILPKVPFRTILQSLGLILIISIPWMIHFGASGWSGNHQSRTIRLEVGKMTDSDQLGHNSMVPFYNEHSGSLPTPVPIQINPYTSKKIERKVEISQNESLRYLGMEKGALKWLSLPFDFIFNTNTPKNTGNHWGLLPFLLLLIFIVSRSNRKHTALVFGTLFLILLYFVLGVGSNLYHLRIPGNTLSLSSSLLTATWTGSALFQNSFISLFTLLPEDIGSLALLIGCTLILYAMTSLSLNTDRKVSAIFVSTPLFFWLFSGSGILWYVLPSLTLLYLFLFPKDFSLEKTPYRWLMLIVASVQIIFFLSNISRCNYPEQPRNLIFPQLIVDYSTDLESLGRPPSATLPGGLRQTIRSINRSDANIYMVNTPLRYFIDQKDRHIIEDDYLNEFWSYRNQLNDVNLFPDLLKANNYEYVAYALTTPSRAGVEVESLSKRCQIFLDVMTTHPVVELVSTNNIVESQDGSLITLNTGQQVKGVPGLKGKTVVLGSYAIFRVK